MHYAFQDFSKTPNDDAVIDQVVKLNSKFYRQDLDLNDVKIKDVVISEGEGINTKPTHTPHIGNMFEDINVTKLIAVHILSSRDNIQGGEFTFVKWGDPTRKDNYGRLKKENNPYPTWLNEQGTLFVIPAIEHMGTQLTVSGQLEFRIYHFRGANYK